MKAYSHNDLELVGEWTDKWLQLIILINEIIGTDEVSGFYTPPTKSDENEYEALRCWFIENETEFIPLWQDFVRYRVGSKCEDIYQFCESIERYPANELPLQAPGSKFEGIANERFTSYKLKTQMSECSEYQQCHDWDDMLDIKDVPGLSKFIKNPFLLFYAAENLYELARSLGLQSRTDVWEPSEEVAAERIIELPAKRGFC